MNSAVEPIFNEKIAEKWSFWVPWTVHGTHKLMKSSWKVRNIQLLFMNSSCLSPWNASTSTVLRFHPFFFLSRKVWLFYLCIIHALQIFSDRVHCSALFMHCSALFTHCSWDPQALYSENNIKNESHNTIHTFKIYFTTVFSVFNF